MWVDSKTYVGVLLGDADDFVLLEAEQPVVGDLIVGERLGVRGILPQIVYIVLNYGHDLDTLGWCDTFLQVSGMH
jgi:hypothetical protein